MQDSSSRKKRRRINHSEKETVEGCLNNGIYTHRVLVLMWMIQKARLCTRWTVMSTGLQI